MPTQTAPVRRSALTYTGKKKRKSGLSRNVPEEKLNRPRFIDEDDNAYGEVI